MKLAALLICAVATVALTGCGKDNSDLILGKWNVDKTTFMLNGEEVENEGEFVSFEFVEGGTGTVVVELDIKQQFDVPITWTLTSDQKDVFISLMGESGTFHIEQLNKKNLTLKIEEVYEDEGETMTDTTVIEMTRA